MMPPRRLSGLQRDVLSLYRKVLRQALAKDRDATASHNAMSDLTIPKLISAKEESSTGFAASEFRKQAGSVLRSDFKRIEYMIRKGEKQIKLLKMPGVKIVGGAS